MCLVSSRIHQAVPLCIFLYVCFSVGMLGRGIIHVQIYCKHKEGCLERNLAITNKIVYAFYPLTQ